MIPRDVRDAIVALVGRGLSKSEVARALGVSRPTVRRVLASHAAEPVDDTSRPATGRRDLSQLAGANS